ncbi:MAG: nicotinate-nucleotide adenylyltransferase [Gammaproteobacteria bacterium]|jgi:nicotinate-nucleotide adenylyltransferase|nr:nicotinate-nucleotide adenylyltransferase [Gammaproteobacteria bacterium]MBT5221586.1 nicotinate-nucleotide adenylyltransferase [Gammaproteobacteria bacterium]MBT5824795.1 nicotinate-nucleotide adenylyltransferase [Gammaproteobacteria bacterium]MBT6420833.1 nicotinate-nucleotide adenylyltransferase [Gammaproteobacteria bacterium]MBT6575684.1 nicotinate-nucleotide adenylyltransferase [Gammaproteobacteria bacterium]
MIGIYGGTFNPVHYGHLRTALEVSEQFALDELRLLPCAQPPHRAEPEVNAAQRFQMLQLAIRDYPSLSCDTRELERSGPSYMVDTLATIRTEIAATPLLLFIGTDAFNALPCWHRWQALFDYAHIVVVTRPGFKSEELLDCYIDRQVDDRHSLKSCPSGKIYFQQVTQLDISASLIRKTIAEGKNSSFLLPESVIEYIQANGLYQA